MTQKPPTSIGSRDAKDDPLLTSSTFVKTASYREALKPEIYYLIGRKGVGKTALAMMIHEIIESAHSKTTPFASGSPSAFFAELEQDFAEDHFLSKISPSEFFRELWDHFIIESCMKAAIAILPSAGDSGSYLVVRRYLEQTGQLEAPHTEGILSFFRRMVAFLANAEIDFGSVKLKTGSGEKIQEFFESKYSYSQAKEALRRLLHSQDQGLLILIDDVDESLMADSSPRYVDPFLKGLVDAVKGVNVEFQGVKLSTGEPSISAKVFVPTDLWTWMNNRHADKIVSNMREINWSRSELSSMFVKRLSHATHSGSTPQNVLVRRHFGKSLYDSFGRERDVLSLLVDNTLMRPRDIINIYDALIVELTASRVSQNSIQNALLDYVSDTVETAITEYSFAYPNIRLVLDEFLHANAVFSYEELRSKLSDRTAPIGAEDVKDYIYAVYEMGAIGILEFGEKSRIAPIHSLQVKYCFDRRRSGLRPFHFVVHPMFRQHYGVRDNSHAYLTELKQSNGV